MKVLLKRNNQEKIVKFTNNNEITNDEIEFINVNHSCDLDDVLNVKLPTKPFIKNNNKLIISLYGLLPYFIEKLNLIDEKNFEIKFVNNNEYLHVIFKKIFEKKNAENYYNLEYSITLSFHLFIDDFRNNKESFINPTYLNELNGFLPDKIITINKNGCDDNFIFSNKIIHVLMKYINNHNLLN